jgi:hypothetical protein
MNRGVTVAETIVYVAIFTLIISSVTLFQRDVFSLNFTIQGNLNTQLDARHLIKVMVSQLREAVPSSTGSYPIEAASSTAIIFYSDINADTKIERVRYFVSGSTIKKGTVSPTGTPPAYNLNSETITTLISNVVSSSTVPVFQYYPSSYDGTTAALSSPVDIKSIRLVKITVIIDNDPNKSPVPIQVTSQVSLRNLKDNL